MTLLGAMKALHLLGAAIWVGGMFFALLVLRPSLAVLEPAQRLVLHGQVFRRFFRMIWHVMPIVLVSGYALLFIGFGGFRGAHWTVHVMHLAGLVMAAVFVAIFVGPWRRMQGALADGDGMAAAANGERIRMLIAANLVIGLATVALAALGG
ncbi:MAG: CopD family protein [Acetobacteraceae bacterium]|nr:CopD family protein [Acetobacteraceae bacterium]